MTVTFPLKLIIITWFIYHCSCWETCGRPGSPYKGEFSCLVPDRGTSVPGSQVGRSSGYQSGGTCSYIIEWSQGLYQYQVDAACRRYGMTSDAADTARIQNTLSNTRNGGQGTASICYSSSKYMYAGGHTNVFTARDNDKAGKLVCACDYVKGDGSSGDTTCYAKGGSTAFNDLTCKNDWKHEPCSLSEPLCCLGCLYTSECQCHQNDAEKANECITCIKQGGCFEEAIYDYPSCSPGCLTNYGGCPNNIPCHQVMNRIYTVNDICYKSVHKCWGCLPNPPAYPQWLEPIECPGSKLAYPYPQCGTGCLTNYGGCPNNIPCHQVMNRVYKVNGQCYKSVHKCWGCLPNPTAYPQWLQPISCAGYFSGAHSFIGQVISNEILTSVDNDGTMNLMFTGIIWTMLVLICVLLACNIIGCYCKHRNKYKYNVVSVESETDSE